jgi:hypothetical protein
MGGNSGSLMSKTRYVNAIKIQNPYASAVLNFVSFKAKIISWLDAFLWILQTLVPTVGLQIYFLLSS